MTTVPMFMAAYRPVNIRFYQMPRLPAEWAAMTKDMTPTHWRAKGPRPAMDMAPVRAALAIGLSAARTIIQVMAKGIQAEQSMLIMVWWYLLYPVGIVPAALAAVKAVEAAVVSAAVEKAVRVFKGIPSVVMYRIMGTITMRSATTP